VHSQPSEVRKRPREEETPQWKCEPCKISLESEGALKAHLNSHETCSKCSFSGSSKVVKGHFQSVHGKYSVSGFKAVTVAIPGCQVQRFRICVGNNPEDIQKWIEDRKKRFPRMSKISDNQAPSGDQKEEKQGLSSLLDGYGSSSSEDNNATTEKKAPVESAVIKESSVIEESSVIKESSDPVKDNRRPCRYFARNGTCRNGDQCSYSHDVANATTQVPSEKRRQQQQHKLGKKKGHSYLLSKLFVNDVRRETTLTLQLLEYLVDSDFLQKPVSGNTVSSR
jgi:hypothetical protein